MYFLETFIMYMLKQFILGCYSCQQMLNNFFQKQKKQRTDQESYLILVWPPVSTNHNLHQNYKLAARSATVHMHKLLSYVTLTIAK